MADIAEAATPARRGNNRARSARTQESLEDQVSKLQDDIKAIGASLAKLSDSKVSEVRSNAKTQYKSLVKSGQHVVDDLSDQVNAYEGQIVEAIREKPLTAVAGAIGIGFLIALLSRR
ncbi:MAG: DNA gyrase subunit B [Devosia sp.]